jgi:hypothetical protein
MLALYKLDQKQIYLKLNKKISASIGRRKTGQINIINDSNQIVKLRGGLNYIIMVICGYSRLFDFV